MPTPFQAFRLPLLHSNALAKIMKIVSFPFILCGFGMKYLVIGLNESVLNRLNCVHYASVHSGMDSKPSSITSSLFKSQLNSLASLTESSLYLSNKG